MTRSSNLKLFLLTTSILLSAIVSAAESKLSPEISKICDMEAYECQSSAHGLVIGTPGNTENYADTLPNAAAFYKSNFGIEAPEAAIILGEIRDQQIRDQISKSYKVVLPWLSLKDRENMVRRSIETQIKAQKPDLEGVALEAVIQKSLEATKQRNSGSQSERVHQGALSHELGHLYFIHSFWPDEMLDTTSTDPVNVKRYGGPANDWLDEMAAVMMETEALTKQRNQGIKDLLTQNEIGEEFWPLEQFFSMPHPAFEAAQAIIRARQKSQSGRQKGGVVVMTSADLKPRPDGREAVNFYLQSRAFADYMREASNNPHIFTDITSHVSAGNSVRDWLSKHGPANNIANTLPALQSDFYAWTEAHYRS